jgi:glycosyltransferase involved in cell wall biosynthesis
MLQVDSTMQAHTGVNERPFVSVVTPAYNEAQNLPVLFERLSKVMKSMDLDWEWIVVDDHSSDDTFRMLSKLSQEHLQVRGFRLARNFGSHCAIACGMHRANGDCAILMAADLQDPPETLPDMIREWQSGNQVIWAVRISREGEKASTLGFSRLYYWIMRHVVGMNEMPATGADFCLMDRRVVNALRQFSETNASVFALITWMGFRQKAIPYVKKARLHGRSGWNLEKKLKLVADSVTSFTYVPIRLMSYLGFLVAVIGFFYAVHVVFNALHGHPPQGWTSLMVVVLVIGGIQMLMMGVLGEYVWRALDESRHRPKYLIEATTEHGDHTESSQ